MPTETERALRRVNLPLIASLVMLLSQVGLIGWAKWTIDSVITDTVRRAVEAHNHDSDAHPNMADMAKMEKKLDEQRLLLEEVRSEIVRLRTLAELQNGGRRR